jgi:hypothetical protein
MLHQYTQRIVPPEEITKCKWWDIRNFVIHLSEDAAIDYPANCARIHGSIRQFTPRVRLVSLPLCHDLLLRPECFTQYDYLIKEFFPSLDWRDKEQYYLSKHAIENTASKLRGMLRKDDTAPSLLLCARNLGYRLCAAPGYGFATTHVPLE